MLHLMNNTSPILQIFRLAAMRLMLAVLVMVALLASTLTFAAGAQLAPFNDGYFVWDARELSINDAHAAIGQFPKLAAHQALIVDRCGLHSVNPRLAALLLDASGTLDEFASSDVAAIGAQAGNEGVVEIEAAPAQAAQRGRLVTFNVGRENASRRARGTLPGLPGLEYQDARARPGELMRDRAADNAGANDND